MKEIKVEIQVTVLAIIIAAAVIGSGFFVYSSFSEIVDSIHREARPDLKLLLIKDITSDLAEIENTVRLYSLTDNEAFLKSYRQINESVQQRLSELKAYSLPGSDELQMIDSIRLLTNQKLKLWDEVKTLHQKKENTHQSFSDLYSKIDTVIIQPDTITIQKKEEKKGFFKRLFGKKDTVTPPPIIIDKSEEKQVIKKEIAEIEQRIARSSKRMQAEEKLLLEQNIRVSAKLERQIKTLESQEQKRLEQKTREADQMAIQTYRRLAVFTVAAVFLLLIVLIVFFRSLQRNRAYQRVLRQAKEEAEGLAKAKEAFVATVSHEMRTPLNAIHGLTEQLLQKENEPDLTTDLNVICTSSEHLLTLVNDTLDFSRIEMQKLQLEEVDFLPENVFADIYVLHRKLAEDKNLQLVVENRNDKHLVLKGDMHRLRQVVINLVANALKFTNEGTVRLVAEGQPTDNDHFLLKLAVSDTGIGIPEADQDRIFEEFVQVDASGQKHRGAGLGLAIVKKLVEWQGGRISVESSPGQGSCFRLEIPYAMGDLSKVPLRKTQQPRIPAWFRQLHFLLVDDEEFNLHLLKNILKKWGVAYTEANNGKEAVELASHHDYDLILMDVRMPVMDGKEATRQIVRQQPNAKIIALTATSRDDDREECLRSGMKGLLQKPFIEADFFQVVLKWVKQPRETEREQAQEAPLKLDELEHMAGDDWAFFREMLEIFIRTSENSVQTIREAFENEQWDDMGEIAHRLAAPSKHMKAETLYRNLKSLEQMVKETPEKDPVEQLLKSIEQEVNQINIILKKKLLDR